MHKIISFGKVILAGAGCGDPELITVKAARYLQEADLVITDRLVSKLILDTYVSADTPIIYVGKQCNQKGSTPQVNINQLLVDYAADKKLIVRLKGGDPAFFSNILDAGTLDKTYLLGYIGFMCINVFKHCLVSPSSNLGLFISPALSALVRLFAVARPSKNR